MLKVKILFHRQILTLLPIRPTINPPIAIPMAIPPLSTLKNIPLASSGVSGRTDVSMYWIRLYPIPSRIPKISIKIRNRNQIIGGQIDSQKILPHIPAGKLSVWGLSFLAISFPPSHVPKIEMIP